MPRLNFSSAIVITTIILGVMTLAVSKVSAVPTSAATFLFAPALLGFLGLSRKAKNSVA